MLANKTKKTLFILSLVTIIALLSVLFINKYNGQNSTLITTNAIIKESTSDELPTFHMSYDYAIAGNTEDLMKFADNVVIGKYEEYLEEWHAGEQFFSELYTFKVEKAIKGNLVDTIKVSIPRNRIKNIEYEGHNYELDMDLPHYSKPDLTSTVVLFLGSEKDGGIYTPSSLPFQIKFTSDGNAELLWRNADPMENYLVQTKSKQYIQVISENYDIAEIDEISGMNKEKLFSELSQK